MLIEWPRLWTGIAPIAQQSTLPRAGLALFLGAAIGIERQWRQRAAGLRTTTLVCFGAAAFVDLGSTIGGSGNTTIIAYVVSGVGFLGAGAIIKDGASIRGLNTAATLWCAAAVGACAGAGELVSALLLTFMLILINIALRPLSRFIDRRALKIEANVIYGLLATCTSQHEVSVRSACLKAIAERPLILRQIRAEDLDEPGDVSIFAEVESPTKNTALLDEIANLLRSDPAVSSVTLKEGPSDSE